MRMINDRGDVLYYNCVTKHGKVRFQVQAASGQAITGRDRQKRKSRTFTHQHQAEKWLQNNGYRAD